MAFDEVTIGACRLIRGDCRTILPHLPAVDTIITDPPYGVGFKGKRTVKGHRSKLITTRPGHFGHADTPQYVQEVVIPVIELCRTKATSLVVMPGTRNLWLYPPADDLGCFFTASGPGMGKWGFTWMAPILYYGKDPYFMHGLGSRPNSAGQSYPNDANTIAHPCAKPLPMMQWLVERASLPGMMVLDPFMGSGTTGVACLQLGRFFIGIEIDAHYFDVAVRRCEEASKQMTLFPPPLRTQQRQMALV